MKKKKHELTKQVLTPKKYFIEEKIIDFLKKIKTNKIFDNDISDFRIKKTPLIIYLNMLLEKSYYKNIFEIFDNFILQKPIIFNFEKIDNSFSHFKKVRNIFFKHFLTYLLNFFKKNKFLINFRKYLIKFSRNKLEMCDISKKFPYNLIFGSLNSNVIDIQDILLLLDNTRFLGIKPYWSISKIIPHYFE